jgi:hypothetical protein
MLRPQVVEGVNGMLKGGFVNIQPKAIAEVKRPRRKRRTGTWSDILGDAGAPGSDSSDTGRSPPPT